MKKSIAMSLAAILLVSSAFAGCSSKPNDSGTPSSNVSSAASQEATSNGERKMEGNMYVEGLPIVKEKTEFSIFCDDGGVAEDKYMMPILEEQTNMKVNLLIFPYETATEKKNLLLNSNDYPEVFGGWILGEKDIIDNGVGEKIFLPLEDLMAKYSPTMTEILKGKDVKATMTAPDGHIYSIPYVIGESTVIFPPYINSKWLEKVNLPMPKTTEEFRTVLKAFKEKDPNGNGKKDEVPFSCDPNNIWHLSNLAGWFGVNASGGTAQARYFAMVNGKLEFSANKDGFKDFIKFFASLNKEGLIDSEMFTQDLAQWSARGKKDVYGCSIAYGSGEFAPITDTEKNLTDFVPLAVLQGNPEVKPVMRRGNYGVTTFNTQVVITDKAKDPASIVRWWDNVFQPDNSVQIHSGKFGVYTEKLDDGSYRYLDSSKLSDADKEKYKSTFVGSLPRNVPPSIVVAPYVGAPEQIDVVKTIMDVYEPFLEEEAIPKVWADEATADRSSIIETDVNTYIGKKMAEWISGQKDVEAEWDAYKAQLDKYGLQELIKIKSDAVEKFKANS